MRNQESAYPRTVRRSLKVLSQQEYRSLFHCPLERSKAFTWTIHASRARETHDGRIMNLNRDAHVGLVSNPSDREMQGSSAHTAAPDLDAWNLSLVEPLAEKRDKIGRAHV